VKFGGILAAVLALSLCARADADVPSVQACDAAGHAAELAAALPANLLLSIGLVESGRADALTGRLAPWPWTVNVDGAGRFFADEGAAIAFVRLAEASGARDVDVGCFQVSLADHPDAFATLADAFDPVQNADYAAGFLHRLQGRTGSWDSAIADYHSDTPDLGLPYERRVLAVWHGQSAAGLGGLEDPFVILQSPAARQVHVYTTEDPANAGLAPGLPRVITP
jgi:soluble lytic murein transglycosylase-like protein